MIEHIIEFSVRNALLLMVAAVAILAGGYYSYRGLPIDAFPDVSPNLVQIFTVTEGLAPEEIEKYVTYPVESAMNGLPGVEQVRSVSNFGLSVVNVYFEDGMDIYFARRLVGERLQEARGQIAEGFGEPELGPISTGMGLVLFYYLDDTTGRYTLEELRTLQDWVVKFQLQTVPGVTEVLGIGGHEKQYHIVVDPAALLRYGITLPEVIESVEANNLNVGAQFIERAGEELVVRSVGLTSTLDDLKSIVIKAEGGTPVYLRDVADVRIGGALRRGLQTRNGVGEVVAGMVIKLFGSNSSTVIGAVEERLAKVNKTLPEGVRIVPYYQQRSLIEACVQTVNRALTEAVLLVVAVVLVFLGGLRPSLVVLLAIPFSVAFTALGMRYLGISANLMSLGGIAIAIGLLVDGSIVMVENVDRLLHQGGGSLSRTEVVLKACKEVARPIAFSLLIIVLVFVPLFTLQGVEGKTFRPLAYTVAMAMTGSLLYAITLAPLLSRYLMRPSRRKHSDNPDEGGHEPFIVRLLLRPYRPLVTRFVRNRFAAVTLAAVMLALGAIVFPRLGAEFTPRLNEGTIAVNLTMAPSISLEESKRIVTLVERRLLNIHEVAEVVSRVGRGEIGAHADPVNTAHMLLGLQPEAQWRSGLTQEGIESAIRERLNGMPGVLATLTQPIELTVNELLEGTRAELAVKLFGEDLDVLRARAEAIAAVLREIRGAADVQVDQVSGTPQLLIRVDRDAIARYGINVADIQAVIKAAVGGETAGHVLEGVRRFDILVRYPPEFRSTPEAIERIYVETASGVRVPLAELASLEEITGPRQITREGNQRFISIQANVIGRDIGSFVEEAQAAMDRAVALPDGYFVTWGGQFRLQQEANKRLAVVVPITLLAILLLLYSSFGSLKNSLLILLNIPLALVGGVLGLWLSGENLSVPASVGFIALFGIALANGMVLVTYQNQLLRRGLSVDMASIQGACLRVRPVLMTAIAAALGLIPLLFAEGTGAEVQRPLATVVVGGLVTSTALTLLVLPALYKWFAVAPERELIHRGDARAPQ